MNSVLFLVAFSSLTVIEAKLDFVQAIFRGGDRSPSRVYPTDPNRNVDLWPNGWAQLTSRGEQEMLELGRFVRERFVDELGFIGGKFDQDQVYLRTSTKRRASESARFFAEALFPDQKVPINANVPYWEDLLLKPSSVYCAHYEAVEHEVNREFYKELQHRYWRLFGFLSEKTGWEVTMSNVGDVYSAFFRERIHGFAQPDWVNTTIYDTVVELKRIQLLSQYSNPILAKLRSGYLLGDITTNIKESIERAKRPKFRIYSSHDDTMNALMFNMDISDEQLIPYAALLLVELHHADDGQYFVRVLYRNDTNSTLRQLSIPGCLFADCPYSLYTVLMEPRTYHFQEEVHKACGHPKTLSEGGQDGETSVEDRPKVEVGQNAGEKTETQGTSLVTILAITSAVLGAVVLVQSVCLFRAIGTE